ncbi:MAG: hypothetical protein AMXMBFR22_17270 [Phycisphaerae bacterium]
MCRHDASRGKNPTVDFNLDRDIVILARTPRVLRSLLDGLPDAWTRANYGPGTWSPHEVVAHLIFGERTDWLPRARRILEFGESVPFDPFDRNGHADLARRHTTAELLDLFEEERRAGLNALQALPLTPENLARRGRHPALGPATLAQLLCTWVVHDLNHIAQVCKGLAYQHRVEVGPWEAYLSILAPPNPR